MLKAEARRLFREKRDRITPAERMKWDDLLLINFQSVDWPFVGYILSFYPVERLAEVNTFLLTGYLHFRNPNLRICYPRIAEGRGMEAVQCNADSIFSENAFGIPEPLDAETVMPAALDMVIVPLVAFDETGIRVGYGKGFYDRFLKNTSESCLKVGVSYFDAVEAIGDANEFDIPLNFCITPRRIYVF